VATLSSWANPPNAAVSVESVESTSKASFDGCLVAKNFVESFAVRDDVLRNRNFLNGGTSHLCELFDKLDANCHGTLSDPGSKLVGIRVSRDP